MPSGAGDLLTGERSIASEFSTKARARHGTTLRYRSATRGSFGGIGTGSVQGSLNGPCRNRTYNLGITSCARGPAFGSV